MAANQTQALAAANEKWRLPDPVAKQSFYVEQQHA